MSKSTIASHRIYTGKILSLDVDQVRFPDGSTGDMEMVRHPGAAAILPFMSDPAGDDPQIMLLKQYRYAADSYMYEIPAGKLEHGEDPRACAERELKEETGCSAEHIEHLFTFYTTPGFSDEVLHVFLASGLTNGKPEREKDEFLSIETMKLSYALKLIQTNEIRDGKTMLAILYAAGFSAGV
ncbi:MAG: NUDIX hydrolase [Gemmatimonadaceae bacterium]